MVDPEKLHASMNIEPRSRGGMAFAIASLLLFGGSLFLANAINDTLAPIDANRFKFSGGGYEVVEFVPAPKPDYTWEAPKPQGNHCDLFTPPKFWWDGERQFL